MEKLFKWTIYLMVFFIIAVLIYMHMWWSFEPQDIKELPVHTPYTSI